MRRQSSGGLKRRKLLPGIRSTCASCGGPDRRCVVSAARRALPRAAVVVSQTGLIHHL
jgi:hypothetical protein